MMIGYARAAVGDQTLQEQLIALRQLDCAYVFSDEDMSGGMVHKAGLMKALAAAKNGDVLVVCQLDRLCRSLTHLIDLIKDIEKRELGFRSLKEAIDTTGGENRSFFHFIGALSGFEQDASREKALANLIESDHPKPMGRPGTIKDVEWIRIKLMLDADKSISECAESTNDSKMRSSPSCFDSSRRRWRTVRTEPTCCDG
jgi:DNA invertase Pin-like site-specific DNA recombinase